MSKFHDFDEDFDEDVGDDDPSVDISKCCDDSGVGRKDFFFGRTLGEGSYARVMHAKKKTDSTVSYAVKIMDKAFIKKEKKVKFVIREKEIMSACNHCFIVQLAYSFQDTNYLYLCMDMATGGDLQTYINNMTKQSRQPNVACSLPVTKFYMAEIIVGLEYLHNLSILHLDIKPENILLTRNGHIKIADFGTAVKDVSPEAIGDLFVGTAQYVSPEILNEDGSISKACDLWAVGCMLYQLLCGSTPFKADTEYLIFVAINGHLDGSQPIDYPASVREGHGCVEMIEGFLKKEPESRLGAGDEGSAYSYSALKQHSFFEGIDFTSLANSEPPEWEAYRSVFLSSRAGRSISTASSSSTASTSGDHDNMLPGEVMHDGALDDWLLEGDATPIMNDQRPNQVTQERKASVASVSKYAKFLSSGERDVFAGIVYKRVGLFSKKRILVLTDAPRLIYIDPDSLEQKGEIPWTADHPVTIRATSITMFDAVCALTGRSYHFTACDGRSSHEWADQVKEVLKRRGN